jgi:hypothetical protein
MASSSCRFGLRSLGWLLLRIQRREVLHQETVDEDVAATDATEKDALDAVVKEASVVPRGQAIVIQHNAKCKMLKASSATTH